MSLNITKKLLLMVIVFTHTCVFAQVGIGTTTPDNSSILQVESTNQGVLLPRLSTAQRNAIASPATSLLIYNTNSKEFQFNYGTPASPNWVNTARNMSVKYSNTNTTTNINSASFTSIPIFGSLNWNDDTSLYTVSSNTLTFNQSGRYRIVLNISYTVPSASGNSDKDVAVQAQLAVNNIGIGTLASTGFVNDASKYGDASLHITEVQALIVEM